METTRELLRGHRFLGGLGDSQIKRLSMCAHKVHFHPGARIFREGALADRFWLIRDGHVALDAQTMDANPVEIDVLGPGDVLGWSWMVLPYTWQFSAMAIDDVLALEFNAAEVRRSGAADLALGYELSTRFARVVIERLQAARLRLTNQRERERV